MATNYDKTTDTNGLCIKCGSQVVHPNDYGDYDDACEWSCSCELNNTRWE